MAKTQKNKPSRKVLKQTIILLVPVALGLLLYSNTLNNPFVFDDLKNIIDNPHIRLNRLNVRDVLNCGLNTIYRHRPIAYISFALNYYFAQFEVKSYHITNIIIHILTGLLLYLLLKHTVNICSLTNKYKKCYWIPFFAAIVWLVHPIQTQAVTYIVQRMTSMSAMFYVLSLLLYVNGRLTQKRAWAWFCGSAVAAIMAIGSKQIAITIPAFIIMYEWFFFQDLSRNWLKKNITCFAITLLIVVALCFLYLGQNPLDKILSGYNNRDFTLTERLLTQPRIVIYYLSLLAFPAPSRLHLDHYVALSHSLINPPTTILSIAAITGLIAFSIHIARKDRLISFCILWFFGNLLLESSFISLELLFEHRLYLPSMFVSLAFIMLLWYLIRRFWVKTVILTIVIATFSFWTYKRNIVWQDRIMLWKDCVAKSPQKERTHCNLGIALVEADRYDEAISSFQKALKINPENAESYNNIGIVLFKKGQTEQAMQHFKKALRIKPNEPEMHLNVGRTYLEKNSYDSAIHHFDQALLLKPFYPEAINQRIIALIKKGSVNQAIESLQNARKLFPDLISAYGKIGTLLIQQRQYEQAAKYFEEELKIQPYSTALHNSLALLLLSQGQINKAKTHLEKSIEIDPYYAETHYTLAQILTKIGQNSKAVIHLKQALDIRPQWVEPMNGMAWLLAAQKESDVHNPSGAIALAKRACELTDYKNPSFMDTLAVAYAANGNFEEALEFAQKALGLAESDTNLAKQLQKRIGLYKQQKPYFENLHKESID